MFASTNQTVFAAAFSIALSAMLFATAIIPASPAVFA